MHGRRRAWALFVGTVLLLVCACQRDEQPLRPGLEPVSTRAAAPGSTPTPEGPATAEPAEAPPVRCSAPSAAAEPRLRPVGEIKSGALALGRADGKLIAFVADQDEQAVTGVDVDGGAEMFREPIGGVPEHVLVAPDGRVFVSVASEGRVASFAFEGGKLEPRCSVAVPAEPTGLALSGDGTLVVASRWAGQVTTVEADTMQVRRSVAVARDPYAVLMMTGGRALVTHVVGGRVSLVTLATGEVTELEATRVDFKTAFTSLKEISPFESFGGRRRFPSGASVRAERVAVQAFAAARRDDGQVLVSATLADGSKAPRGGGYGGGTTDIRTQAGVELVVDADGGAVEVPTGTVRGRSTDCFLPRASAWDGQERLLLVACMGTNRVAAFDGEGRLQGAQRYAVGVAPGPRGLAIDPVSRRLVVWSQFAGAVSVAPLGKRGPMRVGVRPAPNVVTLARTSELPAAVARGRALFHEAGNKRRVAFDGRACASCHPSGRDDGMTWSTEEGPRQTPILMGRLRDTAPFGWNGRMADVDVHLKRTLTRLAGTGVSASQRADLVAYVNHMTPPKAPSRDPQVDAELARGAKLYAAEDGCASCHPTTSQTTDGLAHDLGNAHESDLVRTFNTPTLRFVAQSAPYFHDGRYANLEELLADPATGMGHHATLSPDEQRALLRFVRTL